MVVIKGVFAKSILDSRRDKTILISIKTNIGNFSASSPNGKSTGKYAVKMYKKNIEEDIKTIKKFSDYFSSEIIEEFDDLRRIEDIVEGHIGANSLFALESAILKAAAKEQKKQIWELIILSHDFLAKAKKPKIPRLVGNCIGGGKHSNSIKKPDFQEFLIIPNSKSFKESFEKSKKVKKDIKEILKRVDKNFENKKNDEDAWMTSLNEKEILDILKKIKLPLGIDIASSSFFKRHRYNYENPMLKRDNEEQLGYLSNLINNYNLFYIEDPFNEENFESFSKLLKKFPSSLIVGDDLTVTNTKRFEKAIKMKSINAIIVKPNQIGSLIEVKKVCELARKNNIKIVFSHRSGETEESILADLAYGFESDFFKCGITGKVREIKIKRLIEIEKSLK
jgi:enolase|tara:strand:+ start:4483 stop:5664 length:1182 start_codon:yes stop_codon:yes gene_type:complete